MKIKSIKMENWMPFKGKQEVIFPIDDHANILIINGENMHGKTSLITAFRWCLYGEATSNNSRPKPEIELLNTEASKEGNKLLKVEMNIEADDNNYELTRYIDFNESNAKSKVILKENQRVIAGSEIKNKIEYLIPEQISQFFLFDGELLAEFEQLVIEESGPQSKKIKASIEKALGIPIIQRAIEELDKKNKVLLRQKQSQLAQNNLIARKVKDLDTHYKDKESKEKELEHIKKTHENNHLKVIELDKKLQDLRKDIQLDQKKKSLKKESEDNFKYIKEKKEETKKLITSLWKIPLKKSIEKEKKRLTEELNELEKRSENYLSTNARLASLNLTLSEKICDQCGHELTDVEMQKIQKEIQELSSLAKTFKETKTLQAIISDRLAKIEVRDFVDNTSLIKVYNKEINQKNKRNVQIENDLFEIDKTLDQYDAQNASSIKNQHDLYLKEEGSLEQQIAGCELDIEKIQKDIDQIENDPDIKKASAQGGVSKLPDFANNILKVFKIASEDYRDSMRTSIQKRASDTFGKLTTEDDFDKLDINSSYGLSLIVDNQIVSKSKGAEQIVALSLMDAINIHGRRKGPMIMDTPMGRLDNSHRKKIMHHFPDASTQLAVFVHSGEISKDDRDIYFDKSRIGKMYKITRKNTYHSEIEVDNDG